MRVWTWCAISGGEPSTVGRYPEQWLGLMTGVRVVRACRYGGKIQNYDHSSTSRGKELRKGARDGVARLSKVQYLVGGRRVRV